MEQSKRQQKEAKILNAAEMVFAQVGFPNAKMEDIAKEAGISKGSVYFYFKSKENLYMAITHRAFELLIQQYRQGAVDYETENGITSVRNLFKIYLDYSEQHRHYFELLMNYLSLVRSSRHSERLTPALRESDFFQKVQEIHNVPLNIVVKEIQRGQEDGSISNPNPPQLLYLTAWAMIVGYTELNTSSHPSNRGTFFQVPIIDWKQSIFNMVDSLLLNKAPMRRSSAS